MRIVFVHAPEDYYDQNYGTHFQPLWAYYLAAYVPKHWEVDVLDCRLENPQKAKTADVFAFSGINQDLVSIQKTRKILKSKHPNAIFIIGGPITWSFEQEGKLNSLINFDHVFILDGGKSLPDFLESLEQINTFNEKIIHAPRYPFWKAKKIRFDLMDKKNKHYYGAVVEASRGCPFLCEFCDIRVLPGNNETNTKDIELFIDEIDGHFLRGVTKFQIASDNFIGNSKWADDCVDALIRWKEKRRAKVSFFTWLTINVYKKPKLLKKMREAGFSILFIGIESVNKNSLLETAKVQNMNVIEDAVKTIHSYGFIIAPGFIFGFDSDPKSVFQDTLNFIKNTGVIGGDPSFLTALAGTPLYERMKKSGRLISATEGLAIERKKIRTNIRYLQPTSFLSKGFLNFVSQFNTSDFQFKRLKNNFDLILNSKNFIPVEDGGYASPLPYLRTQFRKWENINMLGKRLFFILRPDRSFAALRGYLMVKRYSKRAPGLGTSFYYWLYTWTNMSLKYNGITEEDFGLHSVGKNFRLSTITSSAEVTQSSRDKSKSAGTKIDIQSRHTQRALAELSRGLASSNPQ